MDVIALAKGHEKYIFIFRDEYRGELLRTFGRYASDPKLSFTWYDAAIMSNKLRKYEESRESRKSLSCKRI